MMPKRTLSPRTTAVTGSAAAFALALAGCSGAVGDGGGGASGEGFAYGASQEEVDAAIADLEPTKITFQVGSTSENSIPGRRTMKVKEEIEARSNGQIEVEVVWGMAIAGYPEAVDAVVDGRVDISYHLISYEPQRFPEATAIGSALASIEYSPLVGEMVAYAVGSSVGWSHEGLMDRYESEGVIPLTPIVANGAYSLNCNSEITTGADMQGKQVRAGSSPQNDALAHFGATPTSMEYTEAFEALQRGAIDCDLSPMRAKEISGVYEAAPHLLYPTTASFPRFTGTVLAGTGYESLPLAYQQILFDSIAWELSGDAQSYIDSNAQHVEDLRSVDGTINEFDTEFQEELAVFLEEQQNGYIEDGMLPDDIMEQVSTLEEEWKGRISDLGYEDGGAMDDIDEWYDPDSDWSDYTWEVHENSGALDFRPGA